MEKLYNKQCKICGLEFETKTKNQKYCVECSRDPKAAWRKYKRSKTSQGYETMRWGSRFDFDRPKKYEEGMCDHCGQQFYLPINSFTWEDENNNKYKFCTRTCKSNFKKEHTIYKCSNCGKEWKYKREIIGKYNLDFCCEACRAEYYRKQAEVNGDVSVCKYCGKKIYKKDAIFCNKDCMNKAYKEGYKPKKRKVIKRIIRNERCVICKKPFQRVYYDEEHFINYPVCSSDCLNELYNKVNSLVKEK